ncbi:hypothetical protein V493_02059 [Pseudogymnoascus sp. VKM F-4281 (FW-2241)]|nr:hypothetical protein V493_02059 [Pseudogymnoascus sp. VKM F-4281 (FW-2241)]
MNTPSVTYDMAEQEALARGYQPDFMVGLLLSASRGLQLNQAYSHCPPVLDDANRQLRRTYFQTKTSRSLRQQRIIDRASAASNIRIKCAGVFKRDRSPMASRDWFNLPDTVNIHGLSMEYLDNSGFPATYTPLGDYEPIWTPIYPFDTSVSTPNIQYIPPISVVTPRESGTPVVPAAALSIHSAPPLPQRTRNLQLKPIEVPPSSLENQFQHSIYEYESDWNDPPSQIFQTSMFKDSHYNTAHYSNPNFQPESTPRDATVLKRAYGGEGRLSGFVSYRSYGVKGNGVDKREERI